MRSRYRAVAIALVLVGISAAPALAQSYPAKPVRFVIGPAPDVLARLVGQKLTDMWGQQIVVDQRPGAGGIIAADIVAKAQPDGYTWLLSTGAYTTLVVPYPKLPYDFVKDFAPVTLMATIPFLLVSHPSLQARSVQELTAMARARPDAINYASSGTGTTAHLAAEMFSNMARIKLVHVPYKGVPAALVGVISGETQLMFAIMQAGFPHVKAGRLRALGVSSAKRSSSAPDIPTIAEAGVPGFEFISWNAIHVPLRTPQPVIAKIQRDVVTALGDPDVRKRMFGLGMETMGSTPAELAGLVRSDIAKWGKVIKDAGVRVQ